MHYVHEFFPCWDRDGRFSVVCPVPVLAGAGTAVNA